MEKKLYKCLIEIQELCSKYYDEKENKSEIIQDIWRAVNFAIIDYKDRK